jgi:hypothetical protein
MAARTTTTGVEALYRASKSRVDIVDVPPLGFVAVTGRGAPDGPAFANAVQALYTVSYGAHFLLKKEQGEAPRVMPLEAQWWMDDPDQQDIVTAVARSEATMADTDRDSWRWQAMIMQPAPIDERTVVLAAEQARKKNLEALDELHFERWEEGRCAQILHVGAYSEEAPSIVRLHEGIAAAGYRPRGRHHEIYLGDPRRSAPEKLRTILRHPVEPH